MPPQFPFLATDRWLVVLRVVLGLYMCAHGVTRAAVGTVDEFGVFLTERGFPLGLVIAWAITITEIAGGLTLAAGRLVRPLCAVFAMQLAMGILLVHGPRGWFTVGHQSGGAEYSVLLVVCFLVVASAARQTTGAGGAGAGGAGA